MNFKTSDLIDEHPDARACELQFRTFGRRRSFCGRIRTVRCFEDNALVREAVSRPCSGEVLVIDAGASLRCALVGDTVAGLALKNGWAGIVINGAVRDTVSLDEMDFGVKALGTNPRRCDKTGFGHGDVPVAFGAVGFNPGQWLYSDEGGIIVSSERLF